MAPILIFAAILSIICPLNARIELPALDDGPTFDFHEKKGDSSEIAQRGSSRESAEKFLKKNINEDASSGLDLSAKPEPEKIPEKEDGARNPKKHIFVVVHPDAHNPKSSIPAKPVVPVQEQNAPRENQKIVWVVRHHHHHHQNPFAAPPEEESEAPEPNKKIVWVLHHNAPQQQNSVETIPAQEREAPDSNRKLVWVVRHGTSPQNKSDSKENALPLSPYADLLERLHSVKRDHNLKESALPRDSPYGTGISPFSLLFGGPQSHVIPRPVQNVLISQDKSASEESGKKNFDMNSWVESMKARSELAQPKKINLLEDIEEKNEKFDKSSEDSLIKSTPIKPWVVKRRTVKGKKEQVRKHSGAQKAHKKHSKHRSYRHKSRHGHKKHAKSSRIPKKSVQPSKQKAPKKSSKVGHHKKPSK